GKDLKDNLSPKDEPSPSKDFPGVDHNKLSVYDISGNYPRPTKLEQALELLAIAIKNNDLDGQALAHSNIGAIYAATGNLKVAVSQLTLANDIYQRIGNEQRVSEIRQRLGEINNQLRNPSPIQINPSPIQIDPSRMIQIAPSRTQIQK
ncbi:tetratricopeptide repeat protein, partial [Limnofasciculus baicalensis]